MLSVGRVTVTLFVFGLMGCRAAERPASTWMVESVMHRGQGLGSTKTATSTLESGILSQALQAWLAQYPESDRAGDVRTYVDIVLQSVLNETSFATADTETKAPLDRLAVGRALQGMQTQGDGRDSVLATLNASLERQPRTPDGGFWYYVYPEWSYLDGVMSFLPFMAATGWSRAEMLHQITLLQTHCADAASGLLVHGYDASRTAVWANATTGASPFVWGRSLGWYMAGLVRAYEVLQQIGLPRGSPGSADEAALRANIESQVRSLAAGLVSVADKTTGVWWQLPTRGGQKDNFLESSSTALFTYAVLAAYRLGIDVGDDAVAAAKRAYNYTLDSGDFVVHYDDGYLGFNATVAVCSLNSTASYEYYTTRPIVKDSLLGEAAFVLASVEMERNPCVRKC